MFALRRERGPMLLKRVELVRGVATGRSMAMAALQARFKMEPEKMLQRMEEEKDPLRRGIAEFEATAAERYE